MEISLRAAENSDRDWLKNAHHASYRDAFIMQRGAYDEKKMNAYFEGTWHAGGIEVILCDNEACGFMVLREEPDCLRIQEIALLPAFQRRGIGTLLLKNILARADSGELPVKLNVMRENRARALYKRLGFTESGKNETHILMECRPRKS